LAELPNVRHEPELILGGGLTGRIVQRYLPDALILDQNKAPRDMSVPQLWGAMYLWEPVADFQCEPFEVRTTIDGHDPTAQGIAAYKARVGKGGELSSRPDNVARQFQPTMTGYTLTRMPAPSRIQHDARVTQVRTDLRCVALGSGEVITYDTLISTIPLPSLISMMEPVLEGSELLLSLTSSPIYIQAVHGMGGAYSDVHVDYRTEGGPYRVTRFQDGTIHAEFTYSPFFTRKIVPGRIYDTHGPQVARTLANLTSIGIHCFGRYARWDSDELLHTTDAQLRAWATNHPYLTRSHSLL
jgi:hypothetical protein